ncbi:hypothetical protein DFQ28_009091 [Apophysomyces sp. BC1034]|nr:hypothetical protein DFQ30_009010 [Apophysomyces sp. BC1015]KAG0173319.1 hypothetical protein DFQ29_007998 [Apophysomyces sp. BC1021]KAG0185606.1 hypothetical protein DFQ28_009091 [Apophysomyces sp. BC1034]
MFRQVIRTPLSSARRYYASVRQSPYEILSLPRDASHATIKKRYYELAKSLHPDAQNGDLNKFREVVQAYEFLIDNGKRITYLRTGYGWDIAVAGDPWRPPPGNRPASYTNAYWAQPDPSYKGTWSSHTNTRFTTNTTFISLLAGGIVAFGILAIAVFDSSHSSMMNAADRHHRRTSHELEQARKQAQLFGNQHAVERMLDHRMKVWREDADKNGNDT